LLYRGKIWSYWIYIFYWRFPLSFKH
jgi:hypothetical protein